jgi:uncharacterized protein with GYD domain
MSKYIALVSWTAEGIKNAKESPKRLDRARELAKAEGVSFDAFYMVMGDCDMVAVMDAPDDAALARFVLRLSSTGAVSTKTMKAFTEDEYRSIMAAL